MEIVLDNGYSYRGSTKVIIDVIVLLGASYY